MSDSDELEPLIDLAAAPASPTAEGPLADLQGGVASGTEGSPAAISHTPETLGDGTPLSSDNAATNAPTPSAPRRLTLAPWYFVRVCAVYIGPVQYVPGKINNRWLIVSETVFYTMTAVQVPLTVALTVLGAINKDKEEGVKSELEACPELAVANILWLLRPAYIGYFLLWAHLLRRKVMRLRKARQAQFPNVDVALAGGTQAENTEATAARSRLFDEEMMKQLPSPLSILTHLRLIALTPLLTWVLTVIALMTWWARVTRCRSTSPHIFLLSSVIIIFVNFLYLMYFGFMFSLALKDLIRGIRSRLPSVAPLSQSAVDRIPLVVYRAADCGATSPGTGPEEHILVPTQWGPAAVVSPGQTRPKHNRHADFLQTFRKPSASSRLPDIEEGTEATPLLDLEDSLDARDSHLEATPLLKLASSEGSPVVAHDSPYPYITLPDDEAKCTICLCDFTDSSGLGVVAAQGTQPDVEVNDPSDDLGHRAVGGAMSDIPPLLRRLSCGHVYHKECIDPWLTQKSGRCPYCQRAVEVPGDLKWSWWKFLKCQCQY